MNTVKENKKKLNSIKVFNLLALMQNLDSKVPNEFRLEKSQYKGEDLLKNGTDNLEKQKYGVEISGTELLPFMTYFRECMVNDEITDIVVGITPHSNDRAKNIKSGVCEYEDADFGEVSVITSEKTIMMYLCYRNPITKKICNYVNVRNTSWKKMPDFRATRNRRQSLIDRIIVTAAIMCEQKDKKKFKSKNEFLEYFYHVEAVEPNVIAKRVKTEGSLNSVGNLKYIDVTYDEMKINILKMIYNKLKNESLRLTGSGGYDDKTYVEFEYEKYILGFDIGFTNMRVEIGG